MAERKYHVYGIGNALIDLQLQIAEQELQALGIEKAGMQLVGVEEQNTLLQRFSSQDLHRASGGSAANTMIALAQLGAVGAYGCLVGDDTLGEFYLEEMAILGIELHNAPVGGETTGTSVILITPDAERTMNTHLGASASFGPKQVNEELISASEWLYVEGYLFTTDSGRAAVKKAVAEAQKVGTKIAVTLSDVFIVSVFGDSLREATGAADLVFANYSEAKMFTGADSEDEVFAALCNAVPNAVMTMSERGAMVCHDGTIARVDAHPTTAVDDTGAGDMFAGGFLYGITHGLSGADSGKLACFLASKVVSQLGPRLRENVKELVREYIPAS